MMLRIFACLISFLILFSGCAGPEVQEDESRYNDGRVVAKVGDHVLTLGTVHTKFKNQKFESVQEEYEKKKEFIDLEIERLLQVDAVREAGITYEADSATIQSYLFQELYKRDAGIKSEVSDSDVERHFERYGGEIQFGPLIVKDSALIDSIYRLLQDGAEWDSLVLEHTLVSIGKKRGGSVGYVPFGQYDEEVQGKAYDLEPGKYSEPFRIRNGWCIVKLFDRIKHSRKDLEENWDIYKMVTTNYSEILRTDEYTKRLLDDYDYRIDWKNIDLLIQISDSVKSAGILPADMPGSAYLQKRAFDTGRLALKLAEYKGGGVTVDDYLKLTESYNPYRLPELRDRYDMEYVLKEIASRRIMVARALELGYDTLQTFKDAIAFYEGNYMIQEYLNVLFAELDTVTEDDIRKHYEEFPEESYRPDQVQLSVIALKTEKEALEVLNKLKLGASFPALAEKYSVDKKTASLGGDLNFFTEKRYTELYNAALGREIGAIGGPVEMYGNYWVFKVTNRLNRELQPLHLARTNIRSKILADRKRQAIRTWIDGLKEQNEIFVDLDLLENDLGISAAEDAGAVEDGKSG